MKLSIFFISILLWVVNVDVSEIRSDYKHAVKSKTKAFELNSKLESISKNDKKVLVAYKGAVISITAKYKNSNKLKSTTFKSGVSLIEYAVENEADNIEIRFVRLSIQQNSPKFLKYNKDIEADKKFILNNFKNIRSNEFKDYLKGYILDSENFTKDEKNVILSQ